MVGSVSQIEQRSGGSRQLQPGELVVIDEFLPLATTELILDELQFAYWTTTQIQWTSSKGAVRKGVSLGRRSESAGEDWFSDVLVAEVRHLEARICETLGLIASHLEPWQAARYHRGGYFDGHLDGGPFAQDPAGERVVTVLLYLNTPGAGGNTVFEELGISVPARAGRLLAWMNLRADGTVNPRTAHAATPVRQGVKTVLTTWSRERAIKASATLKSEA